ncbi:autotransporter outer membrane beta-barrel domain-containing protein [Variovorax sp. J22P271]|uniref:autotransporter family protein n=1 Tax=Variovorax davisae TaxID=3053515 RepID=UPI0025778382|nr:autotransporter outer membrane beta-barrel domain-containing protein [Variovorax sp. J22P271]MDM0032252.1 autotransporter outer membrane beta-barrel domain-containing protein [Variovorax sp. J22P271]
MLISTSRDGNFDVSSRTWLVHGGAEVAQWSMFGADDRLHAGAMMSYGWGSSDGLAAGNPYRADSDTQGVSVGLYGTWYQNDESRLGWYTDLWGQYGWFSNHVDGQALPSVSYDSRVLALSAETGYAWLPSKSLDWVVEPQAQVIWVRGSQDGIVETNGTQIGDFRGSGWISRLGVRVHRTWIDEKGNRTQPYLTLNWWHDAVNDQLAFNGLLMRDLYPQDRYEIKLGVDVQRRKGWSGWGNVGWEFGSQSYHAFTGRLGVKYTW